MYHKIDDFKRCTTTFINFDLTVHLFLSLTQAMIKYDQRKDTGGIT